MNLLIIPLIPIIAAGIIGFIALFSLIIVVATTDFKEVNMCVLGPKQAGKTTWYNYLRDCHENEPQATDVDEYQDFIVTMNNGKKLKVVKVKDIGGSDNHQENYAENLVKDSNVIFFFFNAKQFLDNNVESNGEPNYQKIVCYRLVAIDKWMQANKKEYKYFNIVMSHADDLGPTKDWKKRETEIKEILRSYDGGAINNNMLEHCSILNCTDKKQLEKLVDKLDIK
jgi:hypothetical protein